jgi:hypothetical protein
MADEQRKGWLDRSRDHAAVYGDDQGRMCGASTTTRATKPAR